MTESKPDDGLDQRILVFAPVGKDAPLTLDVLRRTDLKGSICQKAHDLCVEFQRGAAVIMLTEEALEDPGIGELMDCLRSQPAWSDIPVLLFADAERSEIYLRTLRLLEGLRNVVLLERPIRLGAALSLIRSAIRGRQRQYELRDLLRAIAAAREEAETANRLKDEFLATLSHELRTPLNAILGWTTMLRDGNVQQKHVMRALDTIHRNATAQVQIVNDLLDVSRIVRGNVHLSPRLISLGPLLTLSVESITPTAEAKGVTLTTTLGSTPVFVWADHDRLQQVFWNLLSNAVKFTSSGGRIDVRMQTEGPDVRVDIADTGTGISREFLPHVFERFRQADGSSTRTHGGLGLGLAIGRHLVELHGGHMKADSAGEGRGATFSVFLPVREVEHRLPSPLPVERRPRTRTLDLEGAHVLIVDDEEDARELLRVMLVNTGARISEADTAAEALRIYCEDRPDIILADVAMPGQDGYALIRQVRDLAGGEGGSVRAIAVSAYARREDRQRALKSGFNDHVCKPVQLDDLYDAIERVWLNGSTPMPSDTGSGANVH
ncbi:MAG TPA: ATP-binding protein [Vicinamibacterales bacterium]|nr:ATP-binding protein [Vicinamibacterales bacterium]